MVAMHSSTHYVRAGATSSSGKNDKFIQRYADRFQLELDKDWSIRETKLHILQMFLDSTIYDNLSPFYEEYQGGSGSYIKLMKRRPSVVYGLCSIIVDESVGMLFDEGHFPKVKCEHEETTKFLEYINRSCNIKSTMINAARVGSIGSVAIVVKVLNRKFYFDVLNSKHLTPIFDVNEPNKLISLKDKRKLDGASLMSLGYEIPEENKNKYYFLEREWNQTQELYYIPYLVNDGQTSIYTPYENQKMQKLEIDQDRSTAHNLGFCPVVWIQNLPRAHHVDGISTFECVVDISIEIDYHLSQLGRGLYYNSDPTLVIKNPSSIEGNQFIKGGNNVINLDEKGEAYYAEIAGNGSAAVLEFVARLREYGLERARGNRTSPEKLNAAQSGKAMRMLNNPLVSLVSEMRLTYGDFGLIQIYSMCIDMATNEEIDVDIGEIAPISSDCKNHISLSWPDWYPITGQDKFQEAQALQIYRTNGLISQQTAIESIAEEYNISDVEMEKSNIDKEAKEEQNRINEAAKVDPKPANLSGTQKQASK